jgi:phosphate transport system substrate-binding protein
MAIAESRYAIGVGTLAGASAELRALALPARDGSGFATTDEADLRSGRYPLERELFLYVKRDSEGRIDEAATTFLRFALSPPGQQIIERAGFLALSPTQASDQQARLP